MRVALLSSGLFLFGGDFMKVQVSGLSKSFGKHKVLSQLDFVLEPGITAVVGHNGAGKSTLFHILSGRMPPSGGKILIDGVPLEKSAAKRSILFEESYFYPQLTARENIKYLDYCYGNILSDPEIDRLMAQWDVSQDKKKSVNQYSLGMKKRYSMAASLLNSPEFLILDEPLNGLDIDAQELIEKLFADYRKASKLLLFSTHQMEKAVGLADHILILHHGAVRFFGSLKDLAAKVDFSTARVEKAAMQPFLNQPFVKNSEEDGEYLLLQVYKAKLPEFLSFVAGNNIPLYQLDTALPSLYEILGQLEAE